MDWARFSKMKSDSESERELVREFSSERLVFEPISISHATKLNETLRHPSVHEFIDAGDFESLEAITKFIERVGNGPQKPSDEKWRNYVCFLNDELVGLLQATLHGDWAEIAYLFSPHFQGKGYASESVQWLLGYLGKAENIKEFWATTVPENLRSVALLHRIGFIEVHTWDREINSYDPGDKVFKRTDA